jgi:large subunit ribosomal protein L35
MPKIKTNSAAKKRFKRVGKKTIKRASSLRRHILTKKTRKKKRQLRLGGYITAVDVKKMSLLLPYW